MAARAILLDIEGTILPISFVAEILFPAALKSLPSYISENWSSSSFQSVKSRFPEEATTSPETFITYCTDLNSKNSKFSPWKTLQGLLWRQSYESGSIQAPLYADVLPAFESWKENGVGIYIYSSGSIEAQKLLFQHTNYGDVTEYINGYFDPSTLEVENKFDERGYEKIIERTGIREWVFFSDVPKEITAAEKAGIKGYVVIRDRDDRIGESEVGQHKELFEGLVDPLQYI